MTTTLPGSIGLPPARSWRAKAALIALLVLVGAARIDLLASFDAALHGDEATVGYLAQRIINHGDRPVFGWGNDYLGGAALDAYVLSGVFRLTGSHASEAAVKGVPFLLGLLAILVVYETLRRTHGTGAAFLAAALYATSAALMRWSTDARGGYGESQVLVPLALALLHRLGQEGPAARLSRGLVLGFLCGFGTYLLPLFSAVTATSGLLLAVFCLRGVTKWRILAGFVAGWVVGVAPLLQSGSGANNAPVAAAGRSVPHLPSRLLTTLVTDWPRTLSADTLHGRPPVGTIPNLTEGIVILTGLLLLLVSLARSKGKGRGPRIEVILMCYLAIYTLLYSLHPLAGANSRYLLLLNPPLSMLAGLGLHAGLTGRLPSRWAAVIALLLALLGRGAEFARVRGEGDILGVSGRRHPRVALDLIRQLDASGIPAFMTEDFDLRSRIKFLTDDRLRGRHLSNRWFHDPQPEIKHASRYAVVVDRGSKTQAWIEQALPDGAATPSRFQLGELVIYICTPDVPCVRNRSNW